jgi:2-polyprenyl-6-methoxyphenol hydroxylase-like FAD-dependent oxidoreductase
MTDTIPITIVGGGLAGLTLGIALRQNNVPVQLHEAGHYPRHRVCGEFISGHGQASLERLGLRSMLDTAGAIEAHTIAFFSSNRSTGPRRLPSAGICLSRSILDAVLAKKFRDLGGELIEGERDVREFGEGIVRATGRRAGADVDGTRWFGLKIHAQHVTPVADLEMHVSPLGYVGLCRINGGEVNVCGLFRKRVDHHEEPTHWRELLRGQSGSALCQRLANADYDEKSFCAVAGLCIQPQRAVTREEICVGDAITMIPPVTGNGMSMAFESAELAVGPLVAWSRGELSWSVARQKIARNCDAIFNRRLAWAGWLQKVVQMPSLQDPLVALAGRSDWLWRLAFSHTR